MVSLEIDMYCFQNSKNVFGLKLNCYESLCHQSRKEFYYRVIFRGELIIFLASIHVDGHVLFGR